MTNVLIRRGMYRNILVNNETFEIVKDFQIGTRGGFITVRSNGRYGEQYDVIRVRTEYQDLVYTDQPQGEYQIQGLAQTHVQAREPEPVLEETDEQIQARIGKRFEILNAMTRAAIAGDIHALIVSGPPGVGKSHGVIQELEKYSASQPRRHRPQFEIIKGAMSGIGLYATLFRNSGKNNILVFDDCDVWEDQDALNVLKGALDTSAVRRISWNKDSRMLREESIPNTFEFQGSVIFITNLNFTDRRSNRIRAHLEALQSRCHYIDLTIDTMRDKILRIKHIAQSGELFQNYDFDTQTQQDILEFMSDNQHRLREMSLRMALKIADLVKISADWRIMAENTVMYRH